MPSEIVPADPDAAGPDEAEQLRADVFETADAFITAFWLLAERLYLFAKRRAYIFYGYTSMSTWLEGDGPRVGRSWGMFMIQAYYLHHEQILPQLPAPIATSYQALLEETNPESLQAITPLVNRLVARAAGKPKPGDPLRLQPLSAQQMISQVYDLLEKAHDSGSAAATRRRIADGNNQTRLTFSFRKGDLTAKQQAMWEVPLNLSDDATFAGFAQLVD